MRISYSKSIQLALGLGYEEIIDKNAYKGKYYIKNNKIWIHNISSLKNKLNITLNTELEELNYDVDNYHEYKNYTNSMVDNFLSNLYVQITHVDGEATYLNDGMWLLPDGTIEER